jgi:hypothetical protein
MGVGWSHAKTPKRGERRDADRSSANGHLFHPRLEWSIRLTTERCRPQQKSTGYPGPNRQSDRALYCFVPLRLRVRREVSCTMPRGVLSEKTIVHPGFFRMAIACAAAQSSFLRRSPDRQTARVQVAGRTHHKLFQASPDWRILRSGQRWNWWFCSSACLGLLGAGIRRRSRRKGSLEVEGA